MSFEKSDAIILNDHKYKYIREIRNIITEETAVLCEWYAPFMEDSEIKNCQP